MGDQRQNGFTLLELMVTIAVLSVLMTIAVPSFRTILQNNRRAAAANEFTAAVSFTRSEALNRRKRVILCRTNQASVDVPKCGEGNGYENGWVVFIDTAGDASLSSKTQILRRSTGLADGLTLRGNSNLKNSIAYNSFGSNAAGTDGTQTNGTLVLCDSRGWGENARVFVVNLGGRLCSTSGGDYTAGSSTSYTCTFTKSTDKVTACTF